jgi:hypothetical protein
MRAQEDAEDTFHREGAEAAFKKFVQLATVDDNDREPVHSFNHVSGTLASGHNATCGCVGQRVSSESMASG